MKKPRKGYHSVPYSLVDENDRHIPRGDRAEHAAEFLAKDIWGMPDEGTSSQTPCQITKVVSEVVDVDTSPIQIAELIAILAKLKRGKTPGPDEMPMEFFKELEQDTMALVLGILNEWWCNENIPREILRARVVLIFKKGKTSNLANYRPISSLNSIYKIFAAILQRRIADKLDKHLQQTQSGCRRKRGTADALQYIRRVIDKGEMTRTKTILVLLDWEKAFDKVLHKALFEALKRMNLPEKIVRLVQMLYNCPEFHTEIDDVKSEWKTQATGIRQGCPLSPYLFITLMTVMFYDIHEGDRLNMKRHRVTGTQADEVIYADDTICVSEDEAAMNRLLIEIESEGKHYRLRLNKTKCELVRFEDVSRIQFADGTELIPKEEVKYLGCKLNQQGDANMEIRKRIAECMGTLKQIDLFRLHSDSSLRQKLIVYDAVIKSKLMYGLESLELTEA